MITKTSFTSSLALAGAASVLALFNPTSANALTFNWSFVTDAGSTGGAGQTISGTISGLVEGSNSGTGLTVTVDSTPTGQLLGGGWNFVNTDLSGDAFTVTGGAVTFADAFFERNGFNERLFFGGFGGEFPQLIDITNSNPNWRNFVTPTTFTPVASVATPEPSAILSLVGLGLLGLGTKLKRKNS